MNSSEAKSLCESLIQADTEQEVIDCLRAAGFWDDPAVWRDLGDEPENYSTVGNQQSRSEHALAEKLINSIDTKLIAEAMVRGIDPEGAAAPASMMAARDAFFDQQMKDPETLSRSITVAATGKRTPGKPSISIADNGEGQTPSSVPRTILSVLKGSKKRIPFVQGKFHMGGTGVLEFCGDASNVELVVTKRRPELLPQPLDHASKSDWSFTVIRREDPAPGTKSSRFTFLAPATVGIDGKRGVLHFESATLAIFPERDAAYARHNAWGTLFKLYEYDTRAKTSMMLDDGLMARMRLLLPEPALPIRFHECRDFKGHSGSFDTTMIGLIGTLDADYRDSKRDNVEGFDRFELDVGGERFSCRFISSNRKRPPTTTGKTRASYSLTTARAMPFLARIFFAAQKSNRIISGTRSLSMWIAAPSASALTRSYLWRTERNCVTGS